MQIYKTYNEQKMKYPLIINIPHSGTIIPQQIQSKFVKTLPTISNNDWFLNELYDFLIDMGVTIMSANYSRYVVDLNRIITDPIIGDNYNKFTTYRKTIWGKELYSQIPTQEECQKRLENYYYPYHDKLQELINVKLEKFEKILILDLHSGISSTGENDICLGNARGGMSSINAIETLKKDFEKVGYTVGLNTPVTGGKVLRKYHAENNNIECIIFELNFKCYIRDEYIGDEEVTEYNEQLFNKAKTNLKKSFEQYLAYLKTDFAKEKNKCCENTVTML